MVAVCWTSSPEYRFPGGITAAMDQRALVHVRQWVG